MSVRGAAVVLLVLVAVGAFGLTRTLRDGASSAAVPPEVRRTFDHLLRSPDRPVENPRLVGRLRARNGRQVSMWAARTEGGWCYLVRYQSFKDPEAHFAQGGCERRRQFAQEFHSFVGGTLFAGRVQPAVTTMDAFLSETSRLGLRVADGFYLFDVPEGSLITRLAGRDSLGRRVTVRLGPAGARP